MSHQRIISSMVSLLRDWRSLLKTRRRKEKTLSDSALPMGNAIPISTSCRIFWTPNACFMAKICGHARIGVTLGRNFLICFNKISSSHLILLNWQPFAISKLWNLHVEVITETLEKSSRHRF